MKKKILGIMLTLVMVLSLFPGMTMTASAAAGEEAVWAVVDAGSGEPAESAYGAPGTLVAAFAAANNAADSQVTYVKLVDGQDIVYSGFSDFALDAGKTMVLDLKGKTLQAQNGSATSTILTVSGNLTVKNGKLYSNSGNYDTYGIVANAGAVLSVVDCTFDIRNYGGYNYSTAYGIKATDATVTVTRGTITVAGNYTASNNAGMYGINTNGACNLTLDGCTLTATSKKNFVYAITKDTNTTVTVNNCTISATSGNSSKAASGIVSWGGDGLYVNGNTTITSAKGDIRLGRANATFNATGYTGSDIITVF